MEKYHKSSLEHCSTLLRIAFNVLFLFLISNFSSCDSSNKHNVSLQALHCQTLLLIGDDGSLSTATFPPIDTTFLRQLSYAVSKNGGTLVYYHIGNPTDASGLRCTLLPLPEVDPQLMMEKQVEQKQEQDRIINQNDQEIERWIREVQRKFLNDTTRQANTDLKGFFAKADVLLNEPQYKRHKRMLFVVSDGIQSIDNKDSPACFNFQDTAFTLCLCGWKTAVPDTITPVPFEAPQGFIEYYNNFLTTKN